VSTVLSINKPLAAAALRLRGVRSQVRQARPASKLALLLPNPTPLLGAEVKETSGPVRLLGVRDAGRYLGLSPFTIRNMLKDKRILAVAVPGVNRVLLDVRDLDALIESWKNV
jgi:excisionase family DNA binding protein